MVVLEQKMEKRRVFKLNTLQYNPQDIQISLENYSLDSLLTNNNFDELCVKYKEKFNFSKLKTFAF